VSEDRISTETGFFQDVGDVLSKIWRILKDNDLLKSKPKVLTFIRESQTHSCKQVYKISCADENPHKVVNLLQEPTTFGQYGVFLQEIDATMDLAGSFDKRTLEDYLLETGLKMQNVDQTLFTGTILDNDHFVGKNCLSYMENGRRFKLFNKFVQSMETNAVRDRVGNHIFDWVTQNNSQRAKSRDKGLYRGLTQAEVTFYTDKVPSIAEMEHSVLSLLRRVPKHLVYSTPISEQWFAICDMFKHSLIVEDTEIDEALVGLFVNTETERISGQWLSNYTSKRDWCENHLTLQKILPIDTVKLLFYYKTSVTQKGKNIKKLETITINATKKHKLMQTNTCIFSPKLFSLTNKSDKSEFVYKSGLQEHKNCTLELLCRSNEDQPQQYMAAKSDILSRLLTNAIFPNTCDAIHNAETKNRNAIIELTRLSPVLDNVIKWGNLEDLDIFVPYNIYGFKPLVTHLGMQYLLILGTTEDANVGIVYGNKQVTIALEPLELSVFQMSSDGVYYLPAFETIGSITITGLEYSEDLELLSVLEIYLKIQNEFNGFYDPESTVKTNMDIPKQQCGNKKIPVLAADEQPMYSTLPDLAEHRHRLVEVVAYGEQKFHGTPRGVIKLVGNQFFRAGADLETKKESLCVGSVVHVKRRKREKHTRRPYAVVEILEPGAWWFGEYKTLPFVNKLKTGKVIKTKNVIVNGVNRKVFLHEDGEVYRCRKCKLEERIIPGYDLSTV